MYAVWLNTIKTVLTWNSRIHNRSKTVYDKKTDSEKETIWTKFFLGKINLIVLWALLFFKTKT